MDSANRIDMDKIKPINLVSRACPLCKSKFDDSVKFCPQDNTLLTPVAEDTLIGEVIGQNYRIEEMIAEGGWGRVYRARHISLNNLEVAVKVLQSHLIAESQKVQRFQQEAEAASRLAHPGIVGIRDFGVLSGGQPYIVMDFVPGKTLSQLLSEQVSLPHADVVDIAVQCCSALSEAHKAGIIHRDIKPSNIMIQRDSAGKPIARIMDFGLAKVTMDSDTAHSLTETGETIGTPKYMSPEQCLGQRVDARTDIYSLGCTIYEMLCGQPVAPGNHLQAMAQHLNKEPVPFAQHAAARDVPPWLADAVLRCLEKDREYRFQSAADLASAMQSQKKTARRRTSRGMWLLRAITAATVIVAAATFWFCRYHHVNAHSPQTISLEQLLQSAAQRESQAELQLAESDLQKAYVIARQQYGEHSPQMETVCAQLADFYARRQRLNRTEDLLTRAIGIEQAQPQPSQSKLAALEKQLGDVYLRDGHAQRAVQPLEQSLEITKALAGEDDPSVASLMAQLADARALSNDRMKAAELYEQAVKIIKKSTPPDDRQRMQLLQQYDNFLQSRGKAARP